MIGLWNSKPGITIVGMLREVRALSGREAAFLQGEFARLRGLPALLARSRSAGWNDTDRAALRDHLRRASRLSPYLIAALLPGSFLALPFLVWWRDRQRVRRVAVTGNG